jgi:ribosomal protein S18 acetylase RimI-like enzyme
VFSEYEGVPELAAMQALTSRLWSHASGCHVGDLAWAAYQHEGRAPQWRTALWWPTGDLAAAWGWLRVPARHLELAVDPGHADLAGTVLDWADPVTVGALDAERHVVAALTERGYQPEPYLTYHHRDLADLPPLPRLPDGYQLRSVTESDAAERAAVHQAAWAPSRVTTASYRAVMHAWPYEPGLDWVVATPGGRFAASCLSWLDAARGVGELEPVGTAPDHRGRGLAGAACLAALHALRGRGATEAVVYTVDAGHPGAPALYRSLGFVPYATGPLWRKEVAR